MKTNIILSGLLAVLLSSCHYPQFLPPPEDVDVNPYGSYITILHKETRNIEGELIAIDSGKIIVLDELTNKCLTVPLVNIYSFKLRYAKSSADYEAAIPFALVLPFMHGLVSIFTIPVHLIVTIAIAVDARNEFVYKSNAMSIEYLRMFARFPQGVPVFIDIADIHR